MSNCARERLRRADARQVYNMKTGYREKEGKEMTLEQGGVLIIEGIHALNPDYTEKIAAADKFRIFISPMTALQIDDFNVFKTTDHRLGRRMCRDYLFRGNDAARTLRMWGNVRQVVMRWPYPVAWLPYPEGVTA